MKKIGFYGGTFDPIHSGHLNLCYAALESNIVDEIFIVPNFRSPLKSNQPLASFEQRLKMCQLAFEGDQRFKVLDIESTHSSYTIDTLQELKKNFESDQLLLLIGSDQLDQFPKWKDYQKLIENFTPVVLSRGECNVLRGMQYQKIPLMEVSSTQIRERLKNKLRIDFLVPSKVVDYIYFHHLYF